MPLWLEIVIVFPCISITLLAAVTVYTVLSRQAALIEEREGERRTILDRLDRLDRLQYASIRQSQNRQVSQGDIAGPVGIAARRSMIMPEIDSNAGDELKIPTFLKVNRDNDLESLRGLMKNSNSDVILRFNTRKEMFKFVAEVANVDIRPGIKGAGDNCLSVPSRIMTINRFKDVVDEARGTYEVIDKSVLPRPQSNDLAGLADFCESQIALLP